MTELGCQQRVQLFDLRTVSRYPTDIKAIKDLAATVSDVMEKESRYGRIFIKAGKSLHEVFRHRVVADNQQPLCA